MANRGLPQQNPTALRSARGQAGRPAATPRTILNPQHTPRATLHPEQSDLDRLQMDRLAQALLSKDHHDLAALSSANPDLMDEWHQAFQRLRNDTEKTARVWAAAAAVLASAKGLSVRTEKDSKKRT